MKRPRWNLISHLIFHFFSSFSSFFSVFLSHLSFDRENGPRLFNDFRFLATASSLVTSTSVVATAVSTISHRWLTSSEATSPLSRSSFIRKSPGFVEYFSSRRVIEKTSRAIDRLGPEYHLRSFHAISALTKKREPSEDSITQRR